MYKTGEYVVVGNNGICVVEGITTLNLDGIDKSREYYLMKPVFSNKSTVYKPVDKIDDAIRPALTKKEAQKLVSVMPSISALNITDEKSVEKTYKELIRSSDPKALVTLIKTIHARKESRQLKGFKVTALDARYFKQAEEFLYGELSVALDIPRDEIKDYVVKHIE